MSRTETEENRKENPRLDQDVHFVVSGVEFLLQLDTTYPGLEDTYLLRSKEASKKELDEIFWAFAYIETALCDVSKRRDRYTVWNHPGKGLMRVAVDSNSDLNVTRGIFASLPGWNGDDFGFIGSQTLTEFLQDIEATKKFDKDRGFFRSDGSRIVPGEVKEALFKDPFEDDDLDI